MVNDEKGEEEEVKGRTPRWDRWIQAAEVEGVQASSSERGTNSGWAAMKLWMEFWDFGFSIPS